MALNEYGSAGWELVVLSGLGASPTGGMGYRAVFKRPKREVSRLISATPKITAG
ncbi:MAG TPA: hypothetical protein VNF73_06485 [Candidatus Saccharimonadales bacterium]|nr:hypothetical protein [Candidatus Saccharimonadales bacterium]